jgi:hypothetical protein
MPKTKLGFKIAATVTSIGEPAPSWQKKPMTYKILMTNKTFITTINNIDKRLCLSNNSPIHKIQSITITYTSIIT